MAKVLWLGDAGCVSGFAQVTHAIGDRLVTDYGHDIHVLAVNYKGDYWPTPMKLYVPTLRQGNDVRGQSRFLEMLGTVVPDVVISLNDPLVLMHVLFKNKMDPNMVMARFAPILAYTPVDGLNYPTAITQVPDLVGSMSPIKGGMIDQPVLVPVVMAEFGRTAYPDAPLVLHGVDTDFFQPASSLPFTLSNGEKIASRRDAKRALQLDPDCILAVRVDRNSLRKNFADTVTVLAEAMRKEPKLHAWLHCRADDPAGVDLNFFVSRYPDVMDRFHWPGEYDESSGWGRAELKAVYTAGDFFISTSGGEGFGLTLAEAAAMELPIVAMDCSAITEVVGPGGILIPPGRTYTPLSGQDNWLPDNAPFIDAVNHLVASKGLRRTLGQAGRQHVLTNFNWDRAAAQFDALITGVVQKTSGAPAPGGTP